MTESFAIKSDSSGLAGQMLIIEKYANTTQSVHSDQRFIRQLTDRTSNNLDMAPAIVSDGFSEAVFKRTLSRGLNFSFQELSSTHGWIYDDTSLEIKDVEIKFKSRKINASNQPSIQVYALEPVATAHRFMWLFLVAVSLIWGVVAGIALATGLGPFPGVAITGMLGIFVLALTLFRLGRARTLDER